jgi:hypothetical protein
MKLLSTTIGLIGVVVLSNRCIAQGVEDPFSQYLQRSVTISLGAGNAKDSNAAVQTIDPWPPYVGRTRIPGDGRHAVDSVQRMYRTPDPFEHPGGGGGVGGTDSTGTDSTGTGSNAGTLNIGTGTGGPVQPVSGGY